jgi:hypothetical protein
MNGLRNLEFNFIIVLQCLVNIFQRRRHLNSVIYRKTHSHSFSWLDVRILSEDDYLYVLECSLAIGIEYLMRRRKALGVSVFFFYKFEKLFEFSLLNLFLKRNLPIT